jgi:hypothetical protein
LNKNLTDRLLLAFIAGYLLMSVFVSERMISLGQQYKNEMTTYAQELNFRDRLLNGREWVLGDFEVERKITEATEHLNMATEVKVRQDTYSSAFIILSLGFIAFLCVLGKWKSQLIEYLATSIILVAAFCLVNGIAMPMLEIGAFNENLIIPIKVQLPFIGNEYDLSREFSGRMYYYYENKSVIELINVLITQGNYLVGVAILLFSVLIPLTKLSVSAAMLLSARFRNMPALHSLIAGIGKWSMADVFVAASFLAFLSFNSMTTGIQTEAVTLLGLYYFLAYCVLSIASMTLIERVGHKSGITPLLEKSEPIHAE